MDNPLTLERYPSPYQWELKALYANLRGCKKEQVRLDKDILPIKHLIAYQTPSIRRFAPRPFLQIFVGVGSDEAIDMLFRIFCKPAIDNIITTPPTYGMYSVCANVNDVAIKKVPLTPSFDLRIDAMLKAVDR